MTSQTEMHYALCNVKSPSYSSYDFNMFQHWQLLQLMGKVFYTQTESEMCKSVSLGWSRRRNVKPSSLTSMGNFSKHQLELWVSVRLHASHLL